MRFSFFAGFKNDKQTPALMDDLERAHIRASKLTFKLSRNSNADQLNKLKGWNNIYHFTILSDCQQKRINPTIDAIPMF